MRILLYQAEGKWIAHCLETDLLGDGDTIFAAVGMLMLARAAMIGETEVPADAEIVAQYDRGVDWQVITLRY